MSQSINERRHELLLMSSSEVLAIWHKVTGATDDDTTKKTHVMIEEILDREYRTMEPRPA